MSNDYVVWKDEDMIVNNGEDTGAFVKIGSLIKSEILDVGETLEDPDWVSPFWSTPRGIEIYNEFFTAKSVHKYNEEQARDSHGRFGKGTDATISEDSKGHFVVLGSHGSVKVLSLTDDKSPNYVRVKAIRLSDKKIITFAASRTKLYTHHDSQEHARPSKAPAEKPKNNEPAYVGVIRKGVQKFEATGGKVQVFDYKKMSSEKQEEYKKKMMSEYQKAEKGYKAFRDENDKIRMQRSLTRKERDELNKLSSGYQMLRAALAGAAEGRPSIIARNAAGQIVAAMSLSIDRGSVHVGCLGSAHTTDSRGAGTAIQYALAKLANSLGVGVDSSYITSAKGYHESIGRDTRGGGSKWTSEQTKLIAKSDMSAASTEKSMIAIGKLAR